MKHFYIIANTQKTGVEECLSELLGVIRAYGGEAAVSGKTGRDKDGKYTDTGDVPKDTECIITLGGDGTILQAARDLCTLGLPIFGINLGHMGFLAETERSDIRPAMEVLLQDRYYIEERMMLQGEIRRNGQLLHQDVSLNDIVLHADARSRVISFDFYVNNALTSSYQADGMIIATPTGSTAYNLSAGGPIVMPEGKMILATPLNPHTLISRSIVLPPDVEVKLIVGERAVSSYVVSMDSTSFDDLLPGDEIIVRISSLRALMIKLRRDSFLDVLKKKLETS